MLKIRGIQKTTLIDYPGEIACTLFIGGCTFRCAYCYNPALVFDQDTGVSITENEILGFLAERRGFIDGVCLTGGEPLIQGEEVIEFIRKVKALGYKVKLDTNGSFPEHLTFLLKNKLVDYVAMDIKASPGKYAKVTKQIDLTKIQQSIQLLKGSMVEYEFRTTISTMLTQEDFVEIGQWLAGSRRYYLQKVKIDRPLLDDAFAREHQPLPDSEMATIARAISPYFGVVKIRGLDRTSRQEFLGVQTEEKEDQNAAY